MDKDWIENKIKEVKSDISKLYKDTISKKDELELLRFAREYIKDKSIFRHTINNKTFFLFRFNIDIDEDSRQKLCMIINTNKLHIYKVSINYILNNIVTQSPTNEIINIITEQFDSNFASLFNDIKDYDTLYEIFHPLTKLGDKGDKNVILIYY